jgi:hypothetical protein
LLFLLLAGAEGEQRQSAGPTKIAPGFRPGLLLAEIRDRSVCAEPKRRFWSESFARKTKSSMRQD